MRTLHHCLLFSLFLLGCSKDDPVSIPPLPLPPSLSGQWIGNAPGAFTLSLSLSEKRTSVSGSGRITDQTGAFLDGSVSGNNNYPTISLTFYAQGFQPIKIAGSFTDPATLNTLLNESGFSDFPLLFQRQ